MVLRKLVVGFFKGLCLVVMKCFDRSTSSCFCLDAGWKEPRTSKLPNTLSRSGVLANQCPPLFAFSKFSEFEKPRAQQYAHFKGAKFGIRNYNSRI